MKIEDYGESVNLKVFNLLYQEEETLEFDTLYKAWEKAKTLVGKKLVDIIFTPKKEPGKAHRIKILPYDNGYLVQVNWDKSSTRHVKNIKDIYPVISKLLVKYA